MKKNFILTDVMKIGNHQNIEKFLTQCTISKFEETIDFTAEYYHLHNFNLEKYDRKFAMISHQNVNQEFWKNKEYMFDLEKRLSILNDKGFKFILAHPYESEENMHDKKYYDDFLKKYNYYIWSGKHNYFWFLMHEKHKNQNYIFNHNNKKYDFLYLNKQSRPHRRKLFDALQKESLLDNSLISFLDDPHKIKLNSSYELPCVDAGNYPRYGSDQDIYEPQFNDCAFNLVSETNNNNNDVFITEKLWKPIIAQQIFVVHGNLGYLKKLREIGFRTFDSVFDESYDQEPDSDKRIEKIVSLCRHLCTVDKSQIYRETVAIRQHNYNLFFNQKSLSNSINETVLGFLEFADRS